MQRHHHATPLISPDLTLSLSLSQISLISILFSISLFRIALCCHHLHGTSPLLPIAHPHPFLTFPYADQPTLTPAAPHSPDHPRSISQQTFQNQYCTRLFLIGNGDP
ncbi:hypothetical protein I3760_14G012900 [Carya illinoinensis]|nr:hypothetical protein I3760_14G012900 [Carya illinoinensis]